MSTSRQPHDDFVDQLLGLPESYKYDCKRVIGRIDKLLETVIAFANSDGGTIAVGLEDPDKGTGRDRVYGLEEKMENWDEIRRKLTSRITESQSSN